MERRCQIHCPPRRGFSVLESMISLALAALLIAAGTPALRAFLQEQRITAEINHIVSHLHLARTVAISRRASVVMCRSATQRHCIADTPRGADWSGGWIVFIDTDDNGIRGAAEPLLRVRPKLSGGLTVRFNQAGAVRYRSTGEARSGRFTVCDARGPHAARSVVLYWTGRPRTIRESGGRFARACAHPPPAT